jgi:arylsulfatase A
MKTLRAAGDSISFPPALTGALDETSQRDYSIHQSISLKLAIRRGLRKCLDHRGPGETTNRHDKQPEVVNERKALLEASRAPGRTAPRSKP